MVSVLEVDSKWGARYGSMHTVKGTKWRCYTTNRWYSSTIQTGGTHLQHKQVVLIYNTNRWYSLQHKQVVLIYNTNRWYSSDNTNKQVVLIYNNTNRWYSSNNTNKQVVLIYNTNRWYSSDKTRDRSTQSTKMTKQIDKLTATAVIKRTIWFDLIWWVL